MRGAFPQFSQSIKKRVPMKQYAEKFYKSKAWQNTREAYRKSKGGLCEDCLERGLITTGEIVHHVQPITKRSISNPEITLSWNNLRLLCRPCHERIHRRTPLRYTIDREGRVHIIEKPTEPVPLKTDNFENEQ